MPEHPSQDEAEQLRKCLTRYFDDATQQGILYVVGRELNTYEILAGPPSRAYYSQKLRSAAEAARAFISAIDRDWIKTVAFKKGAGDRAVTRGDLFRSKLVLHEVGAVAQRCERAAKANDRGRGRRLTPELKRLIEGLITTWTSRNGPKGTTLKGPLVKFVQTATGFVVTPKPSSNKVRHWIRTARRGDGD
jgi:hypothetical protein